MNTDIVERLEKIGKEMLTLAADMKANTYHEPSFALEAELKQIERQFGSQTRKVIETLALFGIEAKIRYCEKGPVVDRVVFSIPNGIRYSAVTACKDNIMGMLQARGIRIESPTPGSDTVSVEFPHEAAEREEIDWKPLTANENLAKFALPLVIGKTSNGKDLIVDLATLPHLLIGGATGQGKTVLLNSIICGLISNYSPDEVKLVLFDAKRVEFTPYSCLPHLNKPIIAKPRDFVSEIRGLAREVDQRLKRFAEVGCRNIADFNAQSQENIPYIVILVDECADLIFDGGRDFPSELSRLMSKSRAAGIHLIIATAQTYAKVLSGALKANIPGRIAFKTANSIDSRMILEEIGAEDLLGRGDMLMRGKDGQIIRAHGAIIHDQDITELIRNVEKAYPRIESKSTFVKDVMAIMSEEA